MEDLNYILEQFNSRRQDGNGQQGTRSLMVLPSETNPIQDCNGQQGTTGLVVPSHLQTKQHQLNQPNSPKELIKRSGPKATLTEHQKKENKRKIDKKYRQKKKDNMEKLKRENEELRFEMQKLTWQAREYSSENERLKREMEKLQSQQVELVRGQKDGVHQMQVDLLPAAIPISSFGPQQLGASSSTLTEFAPPTSIAPNSRLIFFNSSIHLNLKLTSPNFSAWRQQLQALLIGYGLIGFVDGSTPSPPATLPVPADPNSIFNLWQRQDQLILHLILTSLTESMLPYLSSARTSRDAWVTLHNVFSDDRLLAHEESFQRHNNVEQPVVVTANVAQRNTVQQADSGARFGSGDSNRRRPRQNTPPVRSRLLAHEESLQRHNNEEPPVVVTANVAQRNTVQQADSGARFGSGASNRRRPRQNPPPHGRQEVGYNTQRMLDGKRLKGSMSRGVSTTRPE